MNGPQVESAERWLASKVNGPRTPSSRSGQHRPKAAQQPSSPSPEGDENFARRGAAEKPVDSTGSPERFFQRGNETLYEAYNQLHSLAQEFDKPFDAPAILVVGQQTDGKSALVEALMGFQFNHVGGGTKTRRPISINMKYNAACTEPRCFLITDDAGNGERELTLYELQDHIEAENRRLEQEAEQFWAKEIVVKIEYKYCPNLTIIDTPGLISAPNKSRAVTPLQASARAVEKLVKSKMENKDYIILCLEDSSDWSNASTRNLVLEVDPDMRRTVIVSTKLDTRIPQFSRGEDIERFLRPPARLLDSNILGSSPFFTSVPSGRVGNARDAVFRSDDHFRSAVWEREDNDVAELEKILNRSLDNVERQRVGVSQLRRFLEKLLRRRYLENVPSIVPVLEREYRSAQEKLLHTQEELSDLDSDKLKERGRAFYSQFVTKLPLLIRGTMAAPVDRFGETLADEHIRGGAFVGADGRPLPASAELDNAEMRLMGGAQWTRALQEFRQVVGTVSCPSVNREEIVNACGVDEVHDGINYTRTACVIAVAKAKEAFEPFLHQLGYRLGHVMRRLLQIAMYMMRKDGQFLNGHELFLKRVGSAYYNFVEESMRNVLGKTMEDLESTTEFVSWSLHSQGSAGLQHVLSTLSCAPPTAATDQAETAARGGRQLVSGNSSQGHLSALVENTLWSRKLATVTEDIVQALVCQIFVGIRDHIIASAELKMNCFFLMPVIHKFPMRLREELEQAFDEDIDSVFDVAVVRHALESRKSSLEKELQQVEHIQEKFNTIHHHLTSPSVQAQRVRDQADGVVHKRSPLAPVPGQNKGSPAITV
ncbi:hypothetical protein CYMTET_22934 [Cymbomonas tetramitiformis]|uniref:Dynamin-type G domain-containing protein n=1 Tax=Cymbomonas tetramitiformis TaxID=36881 RepID=A0AAE0FZ98_9CHLO|nr:hypothetical protein CYMTET_22934 [Cymbomonas tetramitiformis]